MKNRYGEETPARQATPDQEGKEEMVQGTIPQEERLERAVVTGKLLLTFENEDLLDEFCLLLLHERVPFAYAGGLSISLHQKVCDQLPRAVRTVYEAYAQRNVFTVDNLPYPTGNRWVPTPEESREALRKLTPKEFLPE